MSFESDIKSFKEWASNLGMPSEVLPTDEALKLVFRSPQNNVMQNLMCKIKPKKQVDMIRKNNLLSKMNKIKEIPIIAKSTQNQLPVEMKRYQKIKKIQEKIEISEATVAEEEIEVEKLQKNLKKKNIKRINLETKEGNLQTKIKLYEGKKMIQKVAIDKEIILEKKLKKIKPVAEMAVSKVEEIVKESVHSNIKKIKRFYDNNDNDNSEEIEELQRSETEKAELWSDIVESIKTIPNSSIFNVLLNNLELYSNKLINLSNLHTKEINNVECGYRIELSKAYAYHIRRHLFVKEIKQNQNNLQHEYCEVFQKFSNNLRDKFNLLSDDENDVINKFIEKFSEKQYYEGQIEFGLGRIEKLKDKVTENKGIIMKHDILINDTHALYKEIEMFVLQIQDDCTKLNLIKEKLDSVKLLTEGTLKQVNSKNENKNNGSFRNRSVSLIDLSMNDSYSVFKDNQICSTIIDQSLWSMNSSFKESRSASFRQINRLDPSSSVQLFCGYSKEIKIFADIPLELFKPSNSKFGYLTSIFDVNLAKTPNDIESFLEILPGHLLTVNGALEELKKFLLFYNKLKMLDNEFHGIFNLIEADEKLIEKCTNLQEKRLNDLFEIIYVKSFKSKELLASAKSYYELLLKNPLSKYIPRTNLFNGRNYQEYEAEFLMYYRLLKGGK